MAKKHNPVIEVENNANLITTAHVEGVNTPIVDDNTSSDDNTGKTRPTTTIVDGVDKKDRVLIGGREYPASRVTTFDCTIVDVKYSTKYNEHRNDMIDKISREEGEEAAEKYAKHTPKFKLVVTVKDYNENVLPVKEYKSSAGAVVDGRTLFLTEHDINAAFGKNEIMRELYHEAIYTNDDASSLRGCRITGRQIYVPVGCIVYNPYSGHNSEGYYLEQHDDVIPVVDSIKLQPFAKGSARNQLKVIKPYIKSLIDDDIDDVDTIMYMLDAGMVHFNNDKERTLIENVIAKLIDKANGNNE